jgi:hypothetical protein
MEISTVEEIEDGKAMIKGGLVVGRSVNTDDELDGESPSGIITPRTEGFTVKNTKFYNFKKDGANFG